MTIPSPTELAPTELGLPYPAWRPYQAEVIAKVLDTPPSRVFVVEAPTGFGKSAVPAALSRLGLRVVVIVGTRDLQEQYAASFPWAKVVWGKGNYVCPPSHVFAQDFQARWGRLPTVEECLVVEEEDPCPDCPYLAAVEEASASSLVVLNYHYAFHAAWWRKRRVDAVVLDEVQRVEPTLRDIVKIALSEKKRRNWNFPPLPAVARPDAAASYLRVCARAARGSVRTLRPEAAVQRLRWARQAEALARAIEEKPDEYLISALPDRLVVRPLDVSPYAARYTLDGRVRVVAMSATPGRPEVLARTLGMPAEGVSVPHTFPPEHRPVYWLRNAPRMSHRDFARAVREQVWFIVRVLADYPSDFRVLVHTASWEHAEELSLLLSRYVPKRPICAVPRDASRVDQGKFLRSIPQGGVAVAPAFWEGIDLEGDLCRLVIVAKIPFPDLSDELNRLLLQRPGGRAWYDSRACLQVVQGVGRAVRGPDDWADAWIMDGNWGRVARHSPGWFEVREVTVGQA